MANTYGHLAETFREEMIRTRLTPLSEDQQRDAVRRRLELDTLWGGLHDVGWRRYARLPASAKAPVQSYGRPDLGVLRALGDC